MKKLIAAMGAGLLLATAACSGDRDRDRDRDSERSGDDRDDDRGGDREIAGRYVSGSSADGCNDRMVDMIELKRDGTAVGAQNRPEGTWRETDDGLEITARGRTMRGRRTADGLEIDGETATRCP